MSKVFSLDIVTPTHSFNFDNVIINIDKTQSLAVRSKKHVPIVFDHPLRFQREGFYSVKQMLEVDKNNENYNYQNNSQKFLNEIAISANEASSLISDAWAKYTKEVDYGIAPLDLNKIVLL